MPDPTREFGPSAGGSGQTPMEATRAKEDPGIGPQSASILVNNFNYDRFVGVAIESALTQTHPAQVIVVDDASTDGSRDVIEAFGERILAVFMPTNRGQVAAMNEGFRVATGDIVVFLDSDDVLEPTAVATLIAGWRAGTALAQYPLTIIDADGIPRGVLPDPPTALADGDVRKELAANGTFAVNVTSGLAFERTALARVMPMPARVFRTTPDGYLVRAVAFLGTVQRFDLRLGSYRVHGRNDSDVCAAPGGLADGFRKKMRYAETEFETTRLMAAEHEIEVAPDLGERDPDYIGYRLFSLLLDPQSHPIKSDRRATLLGRYVKSRWKSPWPARRRVLAVTLATAASLGTRDISRTFIRWLHDSRSRPTWFRALGRRTSRPVSDSP